MASEMVDELLADGRERMTRAIEATRAQFATVRTGRASPALLDRVTVDYYGSRTPLRSLATVSAPEARLLSVTPFDPSSLRSIERAIQESDVGVTPSNDGRVIRLSLPDLTEERRRELVKVARGIAEDGRVSVRTVRRAVMSDLRELKDEGELGSDEEHRAEEELQKLTDARVKEIDDLLSAKEHDILEV
jgi:ribosome recycling factor